MDDWIIAGKQASKLLDYAIKEIRPGMKLIDIAKLLYDKIDRENMKPAFPINLSLNNFAAHYSPDIEDETIFSEEDVLKIDLGIRYGKGLSDTAITLYFGNNNEKKNIVRASFEALEDVKKNINSISLVREIGKIVEQRIKSYGLNPIYNLGGHGIEENDLHVGFIPNYSSDTRALLPEKFAVEPFVTNGEGYVIESEPSEIFSIKKELPLRDPVMKEVLDKIEAEFGRLPFSIFQLRKIYNSPERAIRYFSSYGILEQYPPLKERSNGIVSQFEHTFIHYNGEIIVTTERENERFIY